MVNHFQASFTSQIIQRCRGGKNDRWQKKASACASAWEMGLRIPKSWLYKLISALNLSPSPVKLLNTAVSNTPCPLTASCLQLLPYFHFFHFFCFTLNHPSAWMRQILRDDKWHSVWIGLVMIFGIHYKIQWYRW